MRLYPNPSHLEFVDPVVTGGARAAQTEHSGPKLHHNPHVAVPVLLHGDAAFPGQGVVAETLNLQSLDGYSTGGTIHLITDNQVGFTTDPQEGRSTPYAGDMAKGFNCPIIHVNADDVEACIAAVRLAMAYREQWGRDVVIDLIGYRRYGHNETDEPAYTQPKMAAQIKEHPPVSELYAEQLIDEGVVTAEEVAEDAAEQRSTSCRATLKDLRAKMEARRVRGPELDRARHRRARPDQEPRGRDRGLGEAAAHAQRGAAAGPRQLHHPPQAAQAAARPDREARRRARSSSATPRRSPSPRCSPRAPTSGSPARTPSAAPSRTATWPSTTRRPACATCRSRTSPGALAPFELHNSPLSETACLGFEYGYSAASPESR